MTLATPESITISDTRRKALQGKWYAYRISIAKTFCDAIFHLVLYLLLHFRICSRLASQVGKLVLEMNFQKLVGNLSQAGADIYRGRRHRRYWFIRDVVAVFDPIPVVRMIEIILAPSFGFQFCYISNRDSVDLCF